VQRLPELVPDGFRNRFLMRDVEEFTAWRGIVEEELPAQIAILHACKRDLSAVLDLENLDSWVVKAYASGRTDGHANGGYFHFLQSKAVEAAFSTNVDNYAVGKSVEVYVHIYEWSGVESGE
jgi:hypothetical protein